MEVNRFVVYQAIMDGRQPLLTEEIASKIPALYATDGIGDRAIAYVRYYTPTRKWTLWVTEYSPEEGVMFGLVEKDELGYAYFDMKELESRPIERDLGFLPMTLHEIRDRRAVDDDDTVVEWEPKCHEPPRNLPDRMSCMDKYLRQCKDRIESGKDISFTVEEHIELNIPKLDEPEDEWRGED